MLISENFNRKIYFHVGHVSKNSSFSQCLLAINRDIFRTQSKIYDTVFMRKQLTAFSHYYFRIKAP